MKDERTYAIHHYSATWRDMKKPEADTELQSNYVEKYMQLCERPLARIPCITRFLICME